MTDGKFEDNVSQIPSGEFVLTGHPPTVKLRRTKRTTQPATHGFIAKIGSGAGPSIPPIQAKGYARVVKKTLTDNSAVTDRIDANEVRGPHEKRIIAPPWIGLRRYIRIIAGSKYYEDVVKPTMADIHHLHYEAMMRGDDHGARMIGRFGLLRILLVMLWSPLVRLIQIVQRSIAGN